MQYLLYLQCPYRDVLEAMSIISASRLCLYGYALKTMYSVL